MKSFLQKISKSQKIAIIVIVVLIMLFSLFKITIDKEIKIQDLTWGNFIKKIETAYKIERMKDLPASQVDFETDANFILNNFKKPTYSGDLKSITRDDLKQMKIREAKVSDLPAIVEMHNKGLNKGVWCPLPYKTSAWAMIKGYYEFKKQYGDNNLAVHVAEIDGKLAAVMAGIQDGEKAVNQFTFIDVDIPEKLWAEILVKTVLPFYELARERNLEILEGRVAKGVWFEGFIRDVMKAKNISGDVWHFDRDFILSRVWTEADFEYDNDAVRLAEERNAKRTISDIPEQKIDDIGKIISQTENSDTYKRKDGLREILIYPSPVNIKINGKWMKIDDYLKQPEEILEDKLYAGKQYQLAPFDVSIGADDNNKNILRYNNKDNQISFSLESISYKDKNKNVFLANSEIGNLEHSYKSGLFKDIFTGVDLKYHSTRNGIKEELIFNDSEILKNVSDPDYFKGKIILRTRINFSDGLIPELHNDQIFFKKDGQNIFSTSQPYIYDQEKRTYQVESELKKENDVYYMEIALDYGWMTSDEKAFPIILDPDFNVNPAADVNLCSESTCGTASGVGYGFIKFNISGIPVSATLQSASIILTHSANTGTPTISASRFIDQTWNESSPLATFTGGSFGSVLSTISVGANQPTETWDVLGSDTDGLKKEYKDRNTYFSAYLANTNYSFTPAYVQNGTNLILSVTSNKDGAYYDTYYSREGTTPPVLRVSYTTIVAVCGDNLCNGTETHETCPADCLNSSNATIFDYTNHPSGAKSILKSPGLGNAIFGPNQ